MDNHEVTTPKIKPKLSASETQVCWAFLTMAMACFRKGQTKDCFRYLMNAVDGLIEQPQPKGENEK